MDEWRAIAEFALNFAVIFAGAGLMYHWGKRDGRKQGSREEKNRQGPYDADVSWPHGSD